MRFLSKCSSVFISLGILMFGMVSPTLAAFDGDIMLPQNHVRFDHENFMEGKVVRIYVTAVNNGTKDLLGAVRFTSNGKQIGSDQPISVLLGRSDSVFLDWKIDSPGAKAVRVTILPWEPEGDNPANNVVERNIVVLADTDRDGVPNSQDSDDDNDGVADGQDAFPLNPKESVDTDGDKIGDNADDDDDNDGVKDKDDAFPKDASKSLDTDGDGVANEDDDDDDADGLSDEDELRKGSDALVADTDGDGVIDGSDDFPTDPSETTDFDKDGIGDVADNDDDNDGINDAEDLHPKNKGPVIEPGQLDVTAYKDSETVFPLPNVRDEDGSLAMYEWRDENGELVASGNGGPAELKTVFDQTGEKSFYLRVFDDKGEFRTAEYKVSVLESNISIWIAVGILLLLLAFLVAMHYLRKAQNKNVKKKS